VFQGAKFGDEIMKIFFFFLLGAMLAVGPAATAADLTGTVVFKGVPPSEKEITPILDDPNCSPGYTKAPLTRFYVVGAKGELADVVVSLKGAAGPAAGAGAPPVVIDQKGCLYLPTIVAVQTGQKIVVKNSDACVHNVHSKPTAAGNPESNDVQMPGGADLTYTFANPEPFLKFQCDVHPWMFAWVTVLDSPYFCVSGTNGSFVIKNVPPGKYTVQAAHRKLGVQTQEIEVGATGASAQFTFESK
jgi:plastocyanin